MGTMLDVFGVPPADFWNMTLHEVLAALEARKRANDRLTAGA